MRVTLEPKTGHQIVFTLDIDHRLLDIEAVAQLDYNCDWVDYLKDRIEEDAEECSNLARLDRYIDRLIKELEDLHPSRPEEV